MNRNIRTNARASRPATPGGSPGKGHKPASPMTIGALSVGAVAALGFAGWTISNALGGPAPAPSPATTPPTPVSSARSATPATAPNATAPSAPAVSTVAAGGPVAVAPIRNTARPSAVSEATLAPAADPFIALPPHADPLAAQNAAAQAAADAALIRNAQQSAALPPFPQNGKPYPGTPIPTMPVVAPPIVEIELVGTLLGVRPSAVFRTGEKMVTVPVNGTFAGWKVITVQHGEVVVTSTGRTVRLNVGMNASAGMVRQTQDRPREGLHSTPSPDPPAPKHPDDTTVRHAVNASTDDTAAVASAGTLPLRTESTADSQGVLPLLPDTPLAADGKAQAPPASAFARTDERPFLTPAGKHILASDTTRGMASLGPAIGPASLPVEPPKPASAPIAVHAHVAARSRHASKRHHHRRGRHRRYRSSHRSAAPAHTQRVAAQHNVLSGRGAKAPSAFTDPIR